MATKTDSSRQLPGTPPTRSSSAAAHPSAPLPNSTNSQPGIIPRLHSDEHEWAYGCDHCRFGLIDPPPVRGPLAIANRVQMDAGELRFCDCLAGHMRRKHLLGIEVDMNAAVEQSMADAKARRREQLFVNAGVPLKYQGYSLKGYVQAAAGDRGKVDAIEAIRTLHAKGFVSKGDQRFPGLFLYGNTGMGKTGALSPLFVTLLRDGKIGFWVQYHELLAQVRDFESGRVEERIQALQRAEVVMIDDFGDPAASRMATDYSREVMFRIIDYRADHYLTTLVTSNLDPTGVESQFDGRMGRRLFAICMPVLVTGKPLQETAIEF